jgi:hypothetical protein
MIGALRENVWQWITDDDDERHYLCACVSLCTCLKKKQITNEKGLHVGINGVPSIQVWHRQIDSVCVFVNFG